MIKTKFLKIQTLFRDIAHLALIASALISSCVFGDTVRDPAAIPGGGGPEIVENNLFPGGPGAPVIGAPPPAGSFAAYVRASIINPPQVASIFIEHDAPPSPWLMHGFAAFVNADDVVQQVYIAKKRRYHENNPPANNNPTIIGGHVLNYTHNMHTERQLAIASLSDAATIAAGGVLLVAVPGNPVAPPPADDINQGNGIPGAIPIPQVPLEEVTAQMDAIAGTLHVYTDSPPCRQPNQDNGNFICISYYVALATAFPNINFNIYYQDARMDLNRHFVYNPTNAMPPNPAASFALLNAIAAPGLLNLPNAGGGVVAANVAFENRVRIIPNGTGFLLQCSTNNGITWTNVAQTTGRQGGTIVWNNPDGTPWNHVSRQPQIQTLVNALRLVLQALTQPQRNSIFNAVHNYANNPRINFISIQ